MLKICTNKFQIEIHKIGEVISNNQFSAQVFGPTLETLNTFLETDFSRLVDVISTKLMK